MVVEQTAGGVTSFFVSETTKKYILSYDNIDDTSHYSSFIILIIIWTGSLYLCPITSLF
jgi:hypothetical protein